MIFDSVAPLETLKVSIFVMFEHFERLRGMVNIGALLSITSVRQGETLREA